MTESARAIRVSSLAKAAIVILLVAIVLNSCNRLSSGAGERPPLAPLLIMGLLIVYTVASLTGLRPAQIGMGLINKLVLPIARYLGSFIKRMLR